MTDASIQGVETISAASAGSGVTITLSGQTEGFAITGSSHGHTITGGSGADTIAAGGGNDTINIAAGSFVSGESIDGGAGTDTIVLTTPGDGVHIDFSVGTIANVENLTAPNGSGSDSYDQTITLSATQWAGLSSIDMNDGTDVLNVVASGDISADTTNPTLEEVETSNLVSTSGNDTIKLTGAQLDAILVGSSATINLGGGTGDTINLTSTSSRLNTLGVTDVSIQGVEAISAASAGSGVTITLSGQTEAFAITGSDQVDMITGGNGDDTILGGAGQDWLWGGAGNDTVTYDSSDNWIDGGAGNDTLLVNSGAAINLSSVIDRVNDFENVNASGSSGAVTLTGSSAANALTGGSANDTLNGGGGADMLNGGGGDDTLTGGAGNDAIDGGSGTDTVVFSGERTDYTVTQLGEGYRIVDNRDGSPDGTDTVTNVEYFQFSGVTFSASQLTNVAPVVNASSGSLAYVENQAASPIDTTLTVSDLNSTNLTGATVSITGNFMSGQDILEFITQNGITGSYDASTGVLTLSGTATVAQYQTALRSVTYFNTSDNPSGAPRTVSFQVDDGQTTNHASNVATATVTVTPVNDAAVLSSDTKPLTETDAPLTASGTLTISDVDSPASFVAQTATVGTYGTFAIDAAGAWTYTANSAHNAFVDGTTYTDTFAVRAADGTTTSVTVTILGTNDAPVLSSDTKPLTETDAPLTASGTLTISDVDSPASFVAQTATVGTYGTFAIDAAGAWTYTANSAHNAFVDGTTYTDTFAVRAADGTTTSVTVTILGTNDAAVLSSDTKPLTETDAPLTASGTLTISDVDSPASFVAQTATVGTYGTFAIDAAGAWTYTANSAHNAFVDGTTYTDTFAVRAADGTTTSVTVTILGTNDAPVIAYGTPVPFVENGIGSVYQVNATGVGALSYSLSGADASLFNISAVGTLPSRPPQTSRPRRTPTATISMTCS